MKVLFTSCLFQSRSTTPSSLTARLNSRSSLLSLQVNLGGTGQAIVHDVVVYFLLHVPLGAETVEEAKRQLSFEVVEYVVEQRVYVENGYSVVLEVLHDEIRDIEVIVVAREVLCDQLEYILDDFYDRCVRFYLDLISLPWPSR